MTKRNCYITDVGNAIEALVDALDLGRDKPFKGDIVDLLEWAGRDVLVMRAEIDRLKGMVDEIGAARKVNSQHDKLLVEIADLRQQLDTVSEEFGLPKGIGPAPGEVKRILSDLRQQLIDTRRTAEYWKAEHLAGNEQLEAKDAENVELWRKVGEISIAFAATIEERDRLRASKTRQLQAINPSYKENEE